jgi:hypothetical protein
LSSSVNENGTLKVWPVPSHRFMTARTSLGSLPQVRTSSQ